MKRFLALLLAWLWLALPGAAAPELLVAMASDLTHAGPELARAFELGCACQVKLVFGASGTLTAQIRAGAPFDVFLSADSKYPQALAAAGKVVPGSQATYAIGTLVLWYRHPAAAPPVPDILGSSSLRRLAIANPEHAPYGRAAEAALRHLGRWAALEKRLVRGENVAQAAHFAASGAADAAFVSLAQALSPALQSRGRYWKVPRDAYPPIVQGLVVVKATRQPQTAAAFRTFVLGAAGQAILARFGFEPAPRR